MKKRKSEDLFPFPDLINKTEKAIPPPSFHEIGFPEENQKPQKWRRTNEVSPSFVEEMGEKWFREESEKRRKQEESLRKKRAAILLARRQAIQEKFGHDPFRKPKWIKEQNNPVLDAIWENPGAFSKCWVPEAGEGLDYMPVSYLGRRMTLHQVLYELCFGKGKRPQLRQICTTPRCFNPMHWRPAGLQLKIAPEYLVEGESGEADVKLIDDPSWEEQARAEEIERAKGICDDLEYLIATTGLGTWEELREAVPTYSASDETLREAIRMVKPSILKE